MSQTGVLLINLGTPEAPTPSAVRPYLREFLSDPRVVRLPRVLWFPILYGFVLPFRPRIVAAQYARIWGPGGAPLLVGSQQLAARLREQLGATPVALGMRYGRPAITAALAELKQQGARDVVVLPLYPQYSTTTTESAFDGVRDAFDELGWLPPHRLIRDYHVHDGYIAALRASVEAHWAAQGRGERLLISFHGIPMHYVATGDPYLAQCEATAQRLAESLKLDPSAWQICFQSRFGKAPWTSPYTDEVLNELPARGVKKVDVLCPGFAADCLETLDEIAIRYRAQFERAGGEALRYIPALNDGPAHAALLARLVTERA